MIFLLDVNVLIALIDTDHQHHKRADNWFLSIAAVGGWATCPIVENGLVRIVTHPHYPGATNTKDIASRFATLRARGWHHFWPDDLSIMDSQIFAHGGMTSKDITDIYLLGLAKSNSGKLATFDRRIHAAAVVGGADALHIIDG